MKNRQSTRDTRVLVVDDHAASRHCTLAALRRCGCSVKPARSLAEAVVAAADWLPATVLTDWQLGDGTGAGVVQAIRSRWPRSRAKPRFLLLSGSRADALPADAHDCGFTKIMQKPVAPEELARAVGAEISTQRHSGNGSGTMRRLLRQDLTSGLDRLEFMIANRQLRDAAGVVHRMTGGSAMAGATRLEIALRKLEDVLRENPGPEQAAAAWCSARREALDFLCGLRSLQGA